MARAKKQKKSVKVGIASIKTTFNNTIITISDILGNTICWASSGSSGFKGGNGRETSIRALKSAGLNIISIEDKTSVPHNGCRPPKKRRL